MDIGTGIAVAGCAYAGLNFLGGIVSTVAYYFQMKSARSHEVALAKAKQG